MIRKWNRKISSFQDMIKGCLNLPYQPRIGKYHASISYSFCQNCNARSYNESTRCNICTKFITNVNPCKICPRIFCKCRPCMSN